MAEQIDDGSIQATAKSKMLRELIKQMVKLMKGGEGDTEMPVEEAVAEAQKAPEGDSQVSQESKEPCSCGKGECDGSCGEGEENFASFLNKKPVTEKPVAAKMVFASIAKKPQQPSSNHKVGRRG